MSSGAERRGAASSALLLAVMGSAVFVSVLNNTMVNVAVPLIRADFGVPGGQEGWIITGYSIVYAVGTPLYGRVSDLFSPRRTFSLGLTVFALGSLLCALAPGLLALVGGRALQASGAAAIPALAFGSVARMLPPGERGPALGFISSSVGLGAVAGPVLGGLIAGLAGWHSLFYGTFALVLLLFLGGLYVLPDAALGAEVGSSSLRRLDLPGGLLLAAAAGLTLFAVTEGEARGLAFTLSWGSFLLAALSAVAFAVRIRGTPDPFVSPRLFANGAFLCAAAVAYLSQFATIGSIFLAPLLLVEEGGSSSLAAGLVLAPGAAAVAALSPLAGRLSDRLGPRMVILAGLVLMLAAALFLSLYATARPAYLLTLGLLAFGVGFAAVNSPAANAASATLSREAAGVGLGIYQLFYFLGAGSGPAILGAFLSSRYEGGEEPLNPFYALDAAPFSDAFLLAALALVLAILAAFGVRGSNGDRGEREAG